MSGNAQGDGASVLLVSGRPAFLDPLSQAFSAAGLTVIVARDALVSTAAFNGNRPPPAGVIIDLLTVDEDASDVCDRLRDAPGAASIPILFIGTGAEGVRSTTDALMAGGDGFFQLPVEAARVTAKVVAYVGGPTPNLPMGLMVTVDEYDLLELTPEPLRIIVPRAALPGDLLGDDDDDEFAAGDPFVRGFDDAGDVGHDLGDTPPAGQVRPGRLGDSDEFSSDFADTTSPMTLRPATTVRAGLAPSATEQTVSRHADDGDAAERLKHLGREATRLGAVVEAADAAAAEEEVALQAARQRRVAAEVELTRLARERTVRIAEQEERIAALADERAQQEQAIAELDSARHADEQDGAASLQALAIVRASAEASLQAIIDDRHQRLADQQRRLQSLADQRAAAEVALESLRTEQQQRLTNEEARLSRLADDRTDAEAAIRALADAERVLQADEAARLGAVADQRIAAEAALQAVHAERDRRIADEESGLGALAQQRATVQQALDTLQEAVEALNARSVNEANQARATIAELETACLRLQDDLLALHEERTRREQQAQEALDAANAHHDVAVAAHVARQHELARAVADEHGRLASLEAQRREQESAAQAEEALRLEQLEAQEAQLRHLADQAAAERARLADDTAIAEAALREREAAAAAGLAAMAEEQQRLQEAARVDAERLARLLAEEEAARSSLQDARARARLSFVGGRFDAVPQGTVVSGLDVGAQPRAVGELEGLPVGGPLIDVAVVEHEAPPPLPFRALEPPAGRFDDGELPAVLLAAWSQRVTGKIELCADDDRCRTIHLEDGEPVCLRSALTADRPEEQLLKGGLITAATHSELRVGEAISTRRLCSRLVDAGVIKLEELFSAVRGVLTEQLLHALEWRSGTFSYTEERAHAADRVRLEHAFDAVIAEGVRRKYDEGRLWAVLGGPATLLGPGDTTRCLPPLSSEERLAIERFDGTRCLDDVVLGAGLHGHVVLRAALIGVVAGALRVVARGLPRSADDVVERRHQAIAIDRTRVLDKVALARHGDYFSFLGCESTATPFEVHRAAVRLRERFDPARYTDAVFADLKASLQEILDVLADAEAVLADPALKDSYRAKLRARATAPSTLVGHGSRAS